MSTVPANVHHEAWSGISPGDITDHIEAHNEKVMCETCSATYCTRAGLYLHKMKLCCLETAIKLLYIYDHLLHNCLNSYDIYTYYTVRSRNLIVNWIYNVRLCGWYCILLCYYKLCWIHNYNQVNDNYIILYCAMDIIYDRAVQIHVDWILDVLGSTP